MTSIKINPLTEEEIKKWPTKPLVDLEKPFVDNRGTIQPLVDILMKSAVMIYSKAGSLRANHYHKTDWHYCYVINGKINYYHREFNSEEEPELLVVEKGSMVFTPPLIEPVTSVSGKALPEGVIPKNAVYKSLLLKLLL